MATQSPIPVNPQLTAVALAYRNQNLIQDLVLPRVDAHDEFFWHKHQKDAAFSVPDTKLGRKSEANEVEFTATRMDDSTQDYGLKDKVPLSDMRKAEGTNIDPLATATENLTRLVTLDRERRVAGMVFNAANYATGNKVVLSGTSQWSDYSNSNPLSAILTKMDGMIMRPNALTIGQAVWTILRQHPKIVEAVKGTGAGSDAQGMISREQLAALLEIDNIYVGQAFINGAKKGQAMTLSRTWGKHCALIYQEPVSSTANATTFGFTAQSGDGLRVRSWFDEKVGSDGAEVVQVVDTVKEVITADDLGYFFENAVA
ncbi:phage capsid protein [Denitromonas halophila]|uniref:Phage capsid protein n=1 Tax=Denitromonas halophila TaxID=1629404 RepID=A0A557QLS3_9RHOO|nr:phage capsid protein [Denitromonas halophila]TVO53852.1 phage capsid protein [Denitromonas halophila]